MRYKQLLIFTLFMLILCAKGHAQIIQYDESRVAKIDIIIQNTPPNTSSDKRSILSRMETKVGEIFSQYEFDRDLKTLAEQYDRIEPFIEEKNGELYITLLIWHKPIIKNIIFCGNDKISTKKLKKELEIKDGDIFEREEFIKAYNKLKTLYVKKGFFEAQLKFDLQEVEEGSQIDIIINIQEGRPGKIKKIEFCGFSTQEEKAILELIATKKYRFIFSWVLGGGIYHQEMIDHDRMVILNYLQDIGFADATVNIQVVEDCKDDRIILKISTNKGPIYYFGKIRIEGNCIFSQEELCDQFCFSQGSYFSPEKLRETARNIQDLYGASGYIDAFIDTKLTLHDENPIYDVTVFIEESTQYRVGLVKVFGNRHTQTKVILHESLLCPGEVFDIRKLQGTERRLNNTGYFCSVNVYPVRSSQNYGCDANYRDVYIEVAETDTGNISLFFGFSTLDRIFGGMEVSECNFNIMGVTRLLTCGPGSLRGGGEYIHVKANIGDRQTCYLLQWTKPYFLDTPWIVGFDLEKNNNRAVSHGYEIKSYGGHVHATYICNNFLKYAWHYRITHTSNTLVSDASTLLDKEAAISGCISAFGLAINYDSTDHPRKPTCGFRSKLSGELAGIGGNFQFLKLGYFNSYYYPMWSQGIFKFRLDTQFIYTYGDTTPKGLPLGERLFLGGDTTVRGYRPYIIGPLYRANEPRGGVSSFLISEEYQHTLFRCVDAFVFVDAGYVSLSEFTLGNLRSSYGFGLRVDLMRNLPFTVGMGFPYKATDDETQRFFFSMGGCF